MSGMNTTRVRDRVQEGKAEHARRLRARQLEAAAAAAGDEVQAFREHVEMMTGPRRHTFPPKTPRELEVDL